MQSEGIGAEVQRLSRWRRRILLVIALGYIVWWAGLLGSSTGLADALFKGGARVADLAMIVGLLAWAIPLALLLTSGRRIALRTSKVVRESLEDELTQANRRDAFQTGYWALLFAICALYSIALFKPIGAVVAMPILIAVGVSVPLLRFVALEGRGESDA